MNFKVVFQSLVEMFLDGRLSRVSGGMSKVIGHKIDRNNDDTPLSPLSKEVGLFKIDSDINRHAFMLKMCSKMERDYMHTHEKR